MRIFLLVVVPACGSVTNTPQVPPDAPDACSISIANIALPSSWSMQGPFVMGDDPTGIGYPVWCSNANVPSKASFVVPFMAGDRIIELEFQTYGNRSDGLKTIEAAYQPILGETPQILGIGDSPVDSAQWGHIAFPGLQSTVLSSGILFIRLDVTEPGRCIGNVASTFERPCPKQ